MKKRNERYEILLDMAYGKMTKKEKVFGIGLSRTGTLSLHNALQILGYKCKHFPNDKDTRRIIIQYIRKQIDKAILPVAEEFDCITDTPICVSYKDLDSVYTSSKFILTIRDIDSWMVSIERLFKFHKDKKGYIPLLHEYLYGTSVFNPKIIKLHYEKYVTDVISYFGKRKQDLLIWNLCGNPSWEPLCKFLNKPYRKDNFPHRHKGFP